MYFHLPSLAVATRDSILLVRDKEVFTSLEFWNSHERGLMMGV